MFNEGVTADAMTGQAGVSEHLQEFYPDLDEDVELQQAKIPSKLARYFPIPRLTRSFPKTLLFHGEEDTAIKYQDSEVFDRQLRKMGVDSRFILVKGQGSVHGFERQNYEKFWGEYMAHNMEWLFSSLDE
jgi:dipeptidyl aminopeptidase/acylaminoacyl peptidase